MNILEARRRTLGKGVYKKTVEGNPAIAQGSLARMYPGITMQGWTEQESTTGANLIDYTQAIPRNENQSVEIIDGGVKWTGDYYFMIPVAGLKKNQNYIMTYESDNAGSWAFQYSDGTISPVVENNHSNTTDPEKDCSAVFIYKTNPTVAGQDMVFTNIMLNEGSTALPYEPYTGGAPSPSPDYPQEIVSAGKYDEGTGKYQYTIKISDSEESPTKSQTVTLTADRPLTKWDKLEKRNGQWGWVYKSNRIEMDGNETGFGENYLPILVFGTVPTGVYTDRGSSVKPRYDIWSNYTDILTWSNALLNNVCLNLDNSGLSNIGVNSSETFKQWLAQKYSEGNPFYYEYETDTETFVPLTTAEQEQMNALHTFRPTTVLSNDCECEMTLTYKTKKSLEVAT